MPSRNQFKGGFLEPIHDQSCMVLIDNLRNLLHKIRTVGATRLLRNSSAL
jgi:hypothetical protein